MIEEVKWAGKWPNNDQKQMSFRKLGQKRSIFFGDRVRSGLGIEEAIEREAGRARRGQDAAKTERKTCEQKKIEKLAIILVTPSTLP